MAHQARKRFGQNFLHDKNVIRKIIDFIHPHHSDNIVEIGPGKGALTQLLLPLVDQLNVIELDRDLIPLLEESCKSLGVLHIHSADALRFDFKQLLKNESKLRVVGNLPYNISTPLLFHLLDHREFIQDMYFMLQREVAERLAADMGNKQYGRLTVMLQYDFIIEILFDVAPGSFLPVPKVDSAVVKFVPRVHKKVIVKDWQVFADVVREAFNHRRKTLSNALSELVDRKSWDQLPVDGNLRAERVSVDEFVLLSNVIAERKEKHDV